MKKYNPDTYPVVAIDLYGTILDKSCLPYDFSIETINEMIENGYEVIITTPVVDKTVTKNIFYLIEKFELNPNVKINQQSTYYSSLFKEELSPYIYASIYLNKNSYNAPDYSKEWENIRKEFI